MVGRGQTDGVAQADISDTGRQGAVQDEEKRFIRQLSQEGAAKRGGQAEFDVYAGAALDDVFQFVQGLGGSLAHIALIVGLTGPR